ncbi:signal peptidase II [Clostridium sp. DJ247]|uniref:signal peptidase II n=1 Tax=Clostridium sp. DJ247 TaxID=2726188 RepID=UPI0016267A4A|nr:signal peptidase II [Clostridium sp. DJ247]MBC2580007.1 signal peptidase II [Clostridium sp. DJ247]
MSEFFNVTLDKDVVLDDSTTNNYTGWTSEKILNEIVSHRITKFEELEDVDVINKEDKQVVVYSGDTQKFTTINLGQIGDEAGLSIKQVSKMGIVGDTTTPKIVDIPISTVDFKVPKINVLRFQQGTQDVITTENSFSNSESNDFEADDMVIFDGAAHLKTNFTYQMSYEGDIGTGKTYSVTVDKSNFKTVNSLSIVESGVDEVLNINAIPNDRLLIPVGDMNLSNVSNIDYFNLTATGAIKVVCSVDSGNTWKTFKTDHWEDINLDLESVKINGIDISTFNAINNTYWNSLVTANKIRFAYLLQDLNSIDELKLQYDGQGYWVEAKETEYDVVYASNSLLKVKLYFSGDVKINY